MSEQSKHTFTRVNVEEAKAIMDNQSVVILDIRDSRSYAANHIPGAKHLTDDTVDEFLASTQKDVPVICYCYHGFSSQSVADYLVSQGFLNVYSLDGGFEAWS